MSDAGLETDDLIVVLLGSPSRYSMLQDQMAGITRLEKLMFLLEHEGHLSNVDVESADFEANKFGPFSSKIYQQVEILESARLLEERNAIPGADDSPEAWEMEELIGAEGDYLERQFRLTPRGRRYYEAIAGELPPGVADRIGAFKDRFGSMSLRQLIRYVYERHEAYLTESVIRDQILGGA